MRTEHFAARAATCLAVLATAFGVSACGGSGGSQQQGWTQADTSKIMHDLSARNGTLLKQLPTAKRTAVSGVLLKVERCGVKLIERKVPAGKALNPGWTPPKNLESAMQQQCSNPEKQALKKLVPSSSSSL